MEGTFGFQVFRGIRARLITLLIPVLLLAGSITATAQTTLQDQTAADFSLGTTDINTVIFPAGDGAVSLRPLIFEEFNGTVVPAGWASFPWTGGISTLSGGQVTVSGARLNTVPATVTYGPGTIMEFRAALGADQYQNIGLGGGSDLTTNDGIYWGQTPWATFSTYNTSTTLYARVFNGSVSENHAITGLTMPIGGTFTFRIDWRVDGRFEFFVDNVLVYTSTNSISSGMRPAVSDYNNSGGTLTVDWIKLTPYSSAGTFESRVFDAGETRLWLNALWNASVPAGTSMTVSVRTGDELPLANAYSVFASGQPINFSGRYAQYKADFATSDLRYSPLLLDIGLSYSDLVLSGPEITQQPSDQVVCEGSQVIFSSWASGYPEPEVQWQEELWVDPFWVWTDIAGAVSPELSFTADLSESGKRYRAIWSNTEDDAITTDVTLTVNQLPTGGLSPLTLSVMEGTSYDLTFNSGAGTGPYSITVNGNAYQDVVSGVPFLSTPASLSESVWSESTTITTVNVSDQAPHELGVLFRSTVPGFIQGIRFYRPDTPSSGMFTVSLWDPANQSAPIVSASSEIDNNPGWKQISFATPVPINANTSYLASYHASSSYFYAYHALEAPLSESNGNLSFEGCSYNLTPGVYPATTHNTNYWIDIAFESGSSDRIYNLTTITDANGCSISPDPVVTSQISIGQANVWMGTTPYDLWTYTGNWSDGIVPDETNVVIPVVSNENYPVISGDVTTANLTINPSAELTINSGGTLTVSGDLTTTGADFAINSSSTINSGSLIVDGTATGSITYNRFMPGSLWRYVSSPVLNSSLPTSGGFQFWKWNEEIGYWGDDANEVAVTANETGKGYTILTGTNMTVPFTGGVLTGSAAVNATAPYDADHIYQEQRDPWGGGGWNLLGNPYPSALSGYSDDGISNNDFITHNLSSFDPNYQAIYIYNGTDYYYIAEPTPGYPGLGVFSGSDIQAGQGFFVLAHYTNVPFEFTPEMRKHNTAAEMMKSAPAPWPGVQLKVRHGETETATLVVYREGMSTGLDAGYDVGHLSSGAGLEVYTILAGVGSDFNFARQALPAEVAGTTAVPVGLDFAAGGEVTFSAYTIPLDGSKFWLVDKVTGTFTDLSTKSYTVTLPANSFGTGRFHIIASANTPMDIEHPGEGNSGIRIWNSGGRVIVQGEVGEGSLCEIFTMSGSRVAETRFTGGGMNSIVVPAGTSGLLIVKVTDGPKVVTKKIAIPR